MKRVLFIIVSLVLIISMVIGCQEQSSLAVNDSLAESSNQLTMEEKLRDFESLYKVLEENYPFFDVNKRMNGIDWLSNKDKYIDMIRDTKTDGEYLIILNTILKDLNNGHVGICSKEYYYALKATFDRGNGINMVAWREQLNMPKTKSRYEDAQNKAVVSQPSINKADSYVMPNNVTNNILVDKKVAYLGIASFKPLNIEEDMKVIRPFLESIKDYSALIIDIRGNGGGDESYWSKNLVPMLIDKQMSWNRYFVYRGGDFSTEFIKNKLNDKDDKLKAIKEIEQERLQNTPPELLSKFKSYLKVEAVIKPNAPVGFKGKIYLLVDKGVFSSSEGFAFFTKNTGFATLVGETTGGDGIGQDPLFYSLPESGYLLIFPFVMGLTADGSCNEEHKTVPDVEVFAEKIHDIKKDPAIQYVVKLYK